MLNDILKLKKEYEDDQRLVNELKKKPLTESEIRAIVGNGRDDLETAQTFKRLRTTIVELREQGLIVPDPKENYLEARSEHKNKLVLRASTIPQISVENWQTIRASKIPLHVVEDLEPGETVRHFKYLNDFGEPQITGTLRNGRHEDWTTERGIYGITSPKREFTEAEKKEISTARKRHIQAQDETAHILNKIAEVNNE